MSKRHYVITRNGKVLGMYSYNTLYECHDAIRRDAKASGFFHIHVVDDKNIEATNTFKTDILSYEIVELYEWERVL